MDGQLLPGVFQVAYALVLLAAAATDVRKRRIPNWVSGSVLVTGLAYALVTGGFASALSGLAALALTIVLGYVPWSAGKVGAGDVKLGAAAATAFGVAALPEYWLATALAGLPVAGVCYLLSNQLARRDMALNLKLAAAGVMPAASLKGGNGRVSVPYGVAFVLAALWLVFARRGW